MHFTIINNYKNSTGRRDEAAKKSTETRGVVIVYYEVISIRNNH